jgi:GDP-4-dehydro-6-deoxy-D-mannose reductase
MMRAFVTGASGFVGRHLTEHLELSGDEVTGVDLPLDVADYEAMRDAIADSSPEVIYHLAALAHVGASWGNPTAMIRVNVDGVGAVLAAARDAAPSATVVVVSSAEVYGIAPPSAMPLSESHPLVPASPYAVSKAAAELFATHAVRAFGQRVIIARPFNHIGPGQAPGFFVPAMVQRLLNARAEGREEIPVGVLTTRRDFTDVRDVVRAYRVLALKGQAGEFYNVASGRDYAMDDIAQRLRDDIFPEARFVLDHELVRPVDVPVLRGDPRRLHAATQWEPQISLDASLSDIIADGRLRWVKA